MGEVTTGTENDLRRPFGRLNNDEKQCRLASLRLRDILRLSLRNHDMNRPIIKEWVEDTNTRID